MRDKSDKDALTNIEYYAKVSKTKYMIFYEGKPLYMYRSKNVYVSPASAQRVFRNRTGASKAYCANLIADGKLEFKPMQ